MRAKLDRVLPRRITAQLERQDLKIADVLGAIIDATILQSAARPDRHIDVHDTGEVQIIDSADREARWVRKGASAFYGYRGYAAVDSEDNYVEHVDVHPANEAEADLAGLPCYFSCANPRASHFRRHMHKWLTNKAICVCHGEGVGAGFEKR